MWDEILSVVVGKFDMSKFVVVYYKKLGDIFLIKYSFYGIYWGLDGGDGIMIVVDLCNEVVVYVYWFIMYVFG